MNEAYIVTLCTMSRDLMHDTKDIKMDPPDIKLVSFVDTYDKAKETMKKGLDDLMSNPENNIISLQYVGENAVYVFNFDVDKLRYSASCREENFYNSLLSGCFKD